jgi:hypothetical protein
MTNRGSVRSAHTAQGDLLERRLEIVSVYPTIHPYILLSDGFRLGKSMKLREQVPWPFLKCRRGFAAFCKKYVEAGRQRLGVKLPHHPCDLTPMVGE